MKIPVLAVAAALSLGLVGAAPASAQPGPHRTVVTHSRTVVVHRTNVNNGNHRGWHRRKVCRTFWRHHRRVRTCSWRRW